ncbi:hypothetical protein PV350_46160 [Streptomyces sp. PA03-6a]|nr:hypothetical protein [Streptomyces sp. PA03-6a]
MPFVVFGADTAEETDAIPLVTSLHRIANSAMPFVHVSMVLGPFPVSDAWNTAVDTGYGGRAKIVILREPVPADISTEYAELTEGVLGPDLPPWVGMLLQGRPRRQPGCARHHRRGRPQHRHRPEGSPRPARLGTSHHRPHQVEQRTGNCRYRSLLAAASMGEWRRHS